MTIIVFINAKAFQFRTEASYCTSYIKHSYSYRKNIQTQDIYTLCRTPFLSLFFFNWYFAFAKLMYLDLLLVNMKRSIQNPVCQLF